MGTAVRTTGSVARRRVQRYWAYVLRLGDGSLYVGSTFDVPRRIAQHREGGDMASRACRRYGVRSEARAFRDGPFPTRVEAELVEVKLRDRLIDLGFVVHQG